MADKEENQSTHPIAPPNGHPGSHDREAAAEEAVEPRKRKRTKCLLYVILFVIFQTGIVTLFALTVMKIRSPKFRVREAMITSLDAGAPANPSLAARLNLELSVKNTNFGRYKYRNTTLVFMYRGAAVGEASVPKSRANWRSTRKFEVEADLNLRNWRSTQIDSQQLRNDLNAGVVPITCEGKVRGRVELMLVMKKKKSAHLNCSMEIVTAAQQIRNVVCN